MFSITRCSSLTLPGHSYNRRASHASGDSSSRRVPRCRSRKYRASSRTSAGARAGAARESPRHSTGRTGPHGTAVCHESAGCGYGGDNRMSTDGCRYRPRVRPQILIARRSRPAPMATSRTLRREITSRCPRINLPRRPRIRLPCALHRRIRFEQRSTSAAQLISTNGLPGAGSDRAVVVRRGSFRCRIAFDQHREVADATSMVSRSRCIASVDPMSGAAPSLSAGGRTSCRTARRWDSTSRTSAPTWLDNASV